MSSPFISVSRHRKRSVASSRLTLVGVAAVVALLGMVVPALGGPRAFSAASPVSIAKKALKTAKKANTKSNRALARARKGPANGSITSAKIANLTIRTEDLAGGAIGSGKIANGAIRNEDISPGAIGSGKIANGAVGSADIGDGAVIGAKLADGSVGTAKIPNGAVTTAKLAGADLTGSIHGDAGAVAVHSCTTANITMGGARVGDAALLTFVGPTPVPQGLTFQLLKVSAPDLGTIRFCNPTNAASPAFANVGVRVLTFH
jgi:hypothetical protein